MKFKIYPITEHSCKHHLFGVTCERHKELIEEFTDVVTLLGKTKTKGSAVESVLRESLKLAKNDQEALYLAFYIGEAITEITSDKIGALLKMADRVEVISVSNKPDTKKEEIN